VLTLRVMVIPRPALASPTSAVALLTYEKLPCFLQVGPESWHYIWLFLVILQQTESHSRAHRSHRGLFSLKTAVYGGKTGQ
jgi:hypothetical protein